MGRNPNRVLALVVAAIAVLAVVAAVISAVRPSETFETGSPERTVQAYLRAVLDGDNEAAAEHFAPDTQCDAEDLDRVFLDDPARVVLVDSQADASAARVRVQVVRGAGGLADPSEYTEDTTFRLVRSGDQWLLTGTPWPLYDCEGELK